MYRDKRIALIAVAHNEERLIRPTMEKVPDFVDAIFIIDDASTDRTVAIVRERAAVDRRVELIQHATNQGVGAAVISGYLKARDGNYDVAVVVGGDDQMPMEQMTRLIDPILDHRADYVKGNRFLEGDGPFATMPRIRVVGNTVLSLLTKIASGYYHVFDVVEGYTAMSLAAMKQVDWTKAWRGYGYPMDFLVRMNAYGFRTIDVPRRAIYLPGERQSQIKSLSYVIRVSPMLLRDFLWRLKVRYIFRDFHPLVFLYMVGALFSAVGFAVGLFIISHKIHGDVPSAGTAIICALLLSLGIQSIFFAMLFEMLENRQR